MNQIVIVLLLVLSLGCSKKQSPAPQTASPLQSNSSTISENPAAPAPSAPVQTAQPVVGTVDPGMTAQLRAFMQKNGRLPQDFAELTRAQLDSRPRPPKGMKWAIDPSTAEVKLVKQ